MPAEPLDLGAGLLWWEDDSPLGPRAHATFADSGTGIRLDRLTDRVRCSLTFRSGAMAVDVSIQPGAVVRTCDGLARERCIDPHRWSAVLAGRAARWAGLEPADTCGPVQQTALLRTMTVITHPLLGRAVADGVEPLAEIPRWASPVLRATDARAAARALAGGDATRRVTRSLMASLAPGRHGRDRMTDPTIDLGPLCLAVIGAGLVSADELATVLDERGPARLLAELPSVDDVDVCRRGLAVLPPPRRVTVLRDAARADDPSCLIDVMHHLWWARDRVEHPLPGRITELRRVCAQQVPVLAAPLPRVTGADAPAAPRRPARTRRAPAGPTPTPLPEPAAAEAPVVPPPPRRPAPAPAPATLAFSAPSPNGDHPGHWTTPSPLRPIDGLTVGELRLIVPRSTTELRRWGDVLHNCLADYAGASSRGESWLVAIERDDRVIGCVEIVPTTRRIRQALGPRNRTLPAAVSTTVIRILERHGIVVPAEPATGVAAQPAVR
jgi:hypothetical protein